MKVEEENRNMKNETEATESRYDPILNKIRENKLRNMERRRVRLSVKKQKVLEKVWTDFANARTRFALYRLRKDYNDLSEKGKLLIETQTKMGVWLIHPNTLEDGKTVELRAAEILARRVASSEDVMVKVEKTNVMIQNMSLYYAKITDGSRERTLHLWF